MSRNKIIALQGVWHVHPSTPLLQGRPLKHCCCMSWLWGPTVATKGQCWWNTSVVQYPHHQQFANFFYIISINWLAGFLPSTVFFSMKGECKWWLNKQKLMIWNHWDKDVWMILTVVERFQTPTSFYSNRTRGAGVKRRHFVTIFLCLMDCLHLLEDWNEWNCVLWNIGSVNVLYMFNANPQPCSDRNDILPLNPSLASPQSVLCHVFRPSLAMITASCRSHKRSCLEVSKFSDFQSNLATEKCKMEILWERKDMLQFITSVYF